MSGGVQSDVLAGRRPVPLSSLPSSFASGFLTSSAATPFSCCDVCLFGTDVLGDLGTAALLHLLCALELGWCVVSDEETNASCFFESRGEGKETT